MHDKPRQITANSLNTVFMRSYKVKIRVIYRGQFEKPPTDLSYGRNIQIYRKNNPYLIYIL